MFLIPHRIPPRVKSIQRKGMIIIDKRFHSSILTFSEENHQKAEQSNKTHLEIYQEIKKENNLKLFIKYSKKLLFKEHIVVSDLNEIKRRKPSEMVPSNTAKLLVDSPNLSIDFIWTGKSTTWVKKYGGAAIPKIHFDLLHDFEERFSALQSDFSFQILKMQLLAQKDDCRVEQLEKIFNQCLLIPGLDSEQIQQAFNVMFAIYKMKEASTHKMMKCVELLKNKYGMLPNIKNTSMILAHLYSFRLFEECINFYKSFLKQSQDTSMKSVKIDCHIGAIMLRVYAYTQGIHGAQKFMDEFSSISTQPPNLFMWTSLIRAYSRSRGPRAMKMAEHCFSQMLSIGTIIPDEAAYCCMIDGYIVRKDLNQALEWLLRMLDAGIKPDKSTFNTLQKCVLDNPNSPLANWFAKVFKGQTSLQIKDIKRAWKAPLDNDVARTMVINKYLKKKIKKNQHLSIRNVKNVLQMSEGMQRNPVAIATIMSAFLKSQTRQVNQELFSLFFSSDVHPVTLSQQVISLILLSEYKTKSSANALTLYQKMVEAKIPMTDTIYKNLILIAVKFGEDELMKDVVNRLTIQRDPDCPIPPGMIFAIITIITSHRRGFFMSAANHALTRLVPFHTFPGSSFVEPQSYFFHARIIPQAEESTVSPWLANRELLHGRGDLVLYDTPYVSKNRKSTQLAIQIIQDRLEKGHSVSLEIWRLVIRDALHCDDPETFLITLYGMIQKTSTCDIIEGTQVESSLKFEDLIKVFFMQLFASHQWRLVLFFFQSNYKNNIARKLLFNEWLVDKVKKRDSGSIYTAFYHIFPHYLHDEALVVSFIKAMQQCRSENGLEVVWKLIIHYNGMYSRSVFWSYISALLELKKNGDVLELVTKQSPEWFGPDWTIDQASWLFQEAKVNDLEMSMRHHWNLKPLDS